MAELISSCHIVALPSYYREGLPKFLVEAAACGRAVVTTNLPGCRDAIVPNETGLLCEPRDAEDLATKILQLVTDHQLRVRLGRAGRRLAEQKYDLEKIVKQHLEIYERALQA